MLTMGSLFDGIGGFPLAAVRYGVTPLWASEIEPFPIEVTTFRDDEIASTESARQHKDATDLILQQTSDEDHTGQDYQHISPDEPPRLIRRLTPLECERLQGFPDGWTDLPGACDAARYKALGNSVAIPCVEYVMAGIAAALADTR